MTIYSDNPVFSTDKSKDSQNLKKNVSLSFKSSNFQLGFKW